MGDAGRGWWSELSEYVIRWCVCLLHAEFYLSACSTLTVSCVGQLRYEAASATAVLQVLLLPPQSKKESKALYVL
jgi:hypothetical protein